MFLLTMGNTAFLFFCILCRRSVEISLALKKTFEAAILSELFPHSKIDIYIQVLQSDGGIFLMYSFCVVWYVPYATCTGHLE